MLFFKELAAHPPRRGGDTCCVCVMLCVLTCEKLRDMCQMPQQQKGLPVYVHMLCPEWCVAWPATKSVAILNVQAKSKLPS
jgi:hypothetical protein